MRIALFVVTLLAALAVASATETAEQIRLSIYSDPTKVAVSWVSPFKDFEGVIYGPSGQPSSKYIQSQHSMRYEDGEYQSKYIHYVIMDIENPREEYFYQIVGSEWGLGKVYTFRTRPHKDATSIRFGIVGDIGQTDHSQRTFSYLAKEKLDVVFGVGDHSYADDYQPRWDSWGRLAETLTATTPYMAGVGNHETERVRAYTYRFVTPSKETNGNCFWSLNYELAHVIMLSSEKHCEDYSVGSAQYKWLEAELKSVNRTVTPWLIVMFHRPWYNSNKVHQGAAAAMMEAMEDLLFQARVDLVYAGHVHAYERVARVYKNQLNDKGPMHFIVGAGGNHEGLYNTWIDPIPVWSVKRFATDYGYGVLEIRNATHAHWRYTTHKNGDTEDELELIRQHY